VPEIFVFDAGEGRLHCASCSPSGAEPAGEALVALTVSHADTFMPRWISAGGAHVFFDTTQPLLPTDTDERMDVYEWEPQGTGSCTEGSPLNGGCLFLLSGGKPVTDAIFVDAADTGSDAFFTTRARLVPSDQDGKVDLYDAREGGGFPAASEAPHCAARETCAGPSQAPPSPSFPGTQSFQSSELPPSSPCKKGFAKRHGKCAKHEPRHTRPHKHKKHRAKRSAQNNRRAR
jgi:hypothetical protein